MVVSRIGYIPLKLKVRYSVLNFSQIRKSKIVLIILVLLYCLSETASTVHINWVHKTLRSQYSAVRFALKFCTKTIIFGVNSALAEAAPALANLNTHPSQYNLPNV